jgi:glycerol uptake facilitator-like aquaporin
MFGSVVGAALLLAGTEGADGRDFTGGLGSNGLNPRYSIGNAFVSEMMMTFLLVYVVFETAVNVKSVAEVHFWSKSGIKSLN